MPLFVAYHGLDGAAHQDRVDQLAPQGYRPISLNVSGDPTDARFAAVWQQRAGPPWWAVHGLSAPEYQARFDALVAGGYAPMLISATGPADRATFCAVFEHGVSVPWYARHGLRWDPVTDPDTITHENQRAFDQGYLPRCLAVYGDPSDRRFAGVWRRNDDPAPWSWWWTDPDAYQRYFDGEVAAGLRPSYLSVAPDGWILSVFRDQPIGPWWARHGLTAADYQGEFDVRTAAGLTPIVVQAGGTGTATRYASIFATDDVPLLRSWTVTGAAVSGTDDLDGVVRDFMTAHAIRAGAVAVVRGERLAVTCGYTWAEGGYSSVQPDTPFRIASLSKIFTTAAVAHLVSAGTLAWNTPAFPFLGITTKLLPSQTPDAAISTITVRQLIERRSGLARDFGADLRTIAGQLGLTTPPSRDQLVRYLYGQPLASPPGTAELYSNSAFTLLSSIIEAAGGRAYLDVLGDVTTPLGLHDLRVASTGVGGRHPGEVASYDHPGVALSQLRPATDAMDPRAYGGDFVLEVGEGAGGLVTSAATVARFIAAHAVWDVGGRQLATRYGELDGTTAGAVSRRDGLDLAYVFNRRVSDVEHDGITNSLNAVLDRQGASW